MTRKTFSLSIIILLLLTTVATAAAQSQSNLAPIRAATAPYHNLATAEAAGWQPASPCVESPAGGMGFHYVNGALVDLTIEPTAPELLVYAPGPNGQMQLVAVEYLIPAPPWDALNSSPPTALGQTMHFTPHLDAYTLHVWIWRHNPAGMFADWNPNVTCG